MGFRRVNLGPVSILIELPDKYARFLRRRSVKSNGKALASPSSPPPCPVDLSPDGQELFKQVFADEWYHTIELPYGIVTPGYFDHRSKLENYPIPKSLEGMRVLDLATFDGFWAFELERRGAREVVAVDVATYSELDLPVEVRKSWSHEQLQKATGARFELCHKALGSRVQRKTVNLYDICEDNLGKFDLVFISDVLLHLQNPMKALANVRKVTQGQAIIVDAFHPTLPGKTAAYASGTVNCVWWYLSEDALEQMVRDAGFSEVRKTGVFSLPSNRETQGTWCRAAFLAIP